MFTPMEADTRETGKKINNTARVYSLGQVETNSMETGKKINNTARVYSLGLTAK